MALRNILKIIKHKLIRYIIPENSFLYRWLHFAAMKITVKEKLNKRSHLELMVALTDHCNLNCKGCDHFSCLAQEHFLEITSFERDFARLSELTQGKEVFESIRLFGGEPLLYPPPVLNDIIKIARNYFKHTKIYILTNGTLLLKQSEEFWINCRENSTAIYITHYPIKLDIAGIRDMAKKYRVELSFYDNGNVLKTMWKIPFDIVGKNNATESFKMCHLANGGCNLVDGKIYGCQYVAHIPVFNRYFNQNFEVSSEDYIDIYAVKNVDEIFDFMCKPKPFCRYCNVKEIQLGIKWDISKKEMSEWI
jgi:MoaA/NifB/PqqE/SkfB family radical SAM enzyme